MAFKFQSIPTSIFMQRLLVRMPVSYDNKARLSRKYRDLLCR
ncbi:hypothetical protein HMPREF1870_02067 [Bacteroidales bacterium KA00344]|nr:hypothetical protein HMPREF1870_02067 [Bacteroidales bacterium KA00344]